MQGTSYYFWVLGCVALSPFVPPWLPVLGAGTATPSQLSHLGRAGTRSAGRQCPGGAPGAVGKGPKVVGKGPGRSLGSPQPLQLRQDGLAVPAARLWQMPGIARVFLSLSSRRGNQKYLLPREARRVTGRYPALSDGAGLWLWPEKP